MSVRKSTPKSIETAVLANSARRCALCFHLTGDLSEKHGQIAHLDKDPSNSEEDNLAFLCLSHHSVFDSKTSQHKNYTKEEVKSARSRLYSLVENGGYLTSVQPSSADTDRKILADLLDLLPSNGTMEFIRTFDFGGSFRKADLEEARIFIESRGGPEHEFINPSLEAAQQNFRKKLHALLHSVAMNTYVDYKADRDIQSVQKDLRESNREKYRNIVDKLNSEATEAYTAYEQLVRLARRVLT